MELFKGILIGLAFGVPLGMLILALVSANSGAHYDESTSDTPTEES